MKQSNPRIRFKRFNNKWDNYKLGQLGSFKSGIGFPDSQQGGAEGIPFFKISDMNNIGNETEMRNANNYVTQEQIVKNSWNVIKDTPAIIFAKVGAALMLNRKRLVTKPFLIDNNTMSYSLNKSWDKDFSLTLFQTINLPQYAQIGALPSYNASDIAMIKVNIPSIREQSAIGSLFRTLDDLLAAYKENLANYKAFKTSMLSKMFPKSGQTVPEIRLAGFEGEWKQDQADKIFKPVSEKNRADLPVLSASQVDGMVLRGEIGIDIKYDETTLINYKVVRPNQFVIHLRSFQGGFALSKIEGITSPAYTIIDFIEKDKHNSEFWNCILTSTSFIKLLETVTYGIRDGKSISFKDFSSLKFMFPTPEEQIAIANFFSNLDTLISSYQDKITQLEILKKKLLQDMFI
ncbi:restriction endonuclease subunit S [Streptococcus sanguinis]|nr:restriction endonuclease subunit S [Streptococcus sanguinis]MBZ2069021.1 restriction endonuclease subunit S [Streptococcus sanguinis]MBZ2070488.1 restriction endonuclease subunit S [Streptococcus sanguinis]